MQVVYHGGSWALGVLCATVYWGHLEPWWLLVAPVFLFGTGVNINYSWKR